MTIIKFSIYKQGVFIRWYNNNINLSWTVVSITVISFFIYIVNLYSHTFGIKVSPVNVITSRNITTVNMNTDTLT